MVEALPTLLESHSNTSEAVERIMDGTERAHTRYEMTIYVTDLPMGNGRLNLFK